MEGLRKPFQGITNIIRFNWHFYVLSFVLLVVQLSFHYYFSSVLITLPITISLVVSWYVYDVSNLYQLKWLDELKKEENNKILNINAGFDETSVLLKQKFPSAELIVFDFYDPEKHTEVSIQRARKAYPPFPNTQSIKTSSLPLSDHSVDKIFLTLAAHEIRSDEERSVFFNELRRVLTPQGQILVTEHLRDLPNFLAYNIGFFHFIPKASWKKNFKDAELNISKEIRITPFITTFILEKYGTAS
ncbi:MAG: class I SAM-dependent methyltransferase [Bacteroidetes bacterium]|nr:class I SAM-dependent methyltransferase [Bacteroidota bacterium]